MRDPRQIEADFARLWYAYPKKQARMSAFRAYADIHEAPIEQMMATVLGMKKTPEWTRDGGQYVPRLDRWLLDRRWEDEPPAEESPQSKMDRAVADERRRRGIDPTTGKRLVPDA